MEAEETTETRVLSKGEREPVQSVQKRSERDTLQQQLDHAEDEYAELYKKFHTYQTQQEELTVRNSKALALLKRKLTAEATSLRETKKSIAEKNEQWQEKVASLEESAERRVSAAREEHLEHLRNFQHRVYQLEVEKTELSEGKAGTQIAPTHEERGDERAQRRAQTRPDFATRCRGADGRVDRGGSPMAGGICASGRRTCSAMPGPDIAHSV
eukprot:2591988-Rhodomonas_salina.1